MTTDSPAAVLYRSDGYELAVVPGAALPSQPRAILPAGSDGTNAVVIKVDSTGRQVVAGAGTAGSQTGGVITIQGDPAGTPVPISGTITASNASIGSNGAAIPSSSTQIGGSDGTNLQAARVFDVDSGGGTQYVLGINLRKIASGGSVELGTSSDPIRVDPTGTTTQPVSGTVTANQGGTWTVQPGNTANTTPWLTTISQGGNSATVTGSNALKVDGSAVTQPVSGTVTANIGTTNGLALDATLAKLTIAQSTALGSNTQALVGGSVTTAAPTYTTGNINPLSLTTSGLLRVDGSGVTQPISGTVTANAGTGNFTVVQATASNLNATVVGTGTDDTTNSTAKLPVLAARANTAAPTWSNGNMVPLSVDTAGALRITGSITASNASIGSNGAAIPTSSTQIGGSDGTNLQALRVFDGDTGAGTQYILGVGLRKFASGGSVELGTSSDPIRVDPTGTTTQPVSGTVTANIGTTNGLALDATLAKLTIAQSTALGSNTQALIGGSVTTAAPTYTTGNINPLSLTTAGALRVDGSGSTQPISGTVTANAGTGTFTTQDTSSLVDNNTFTDGTSRVLPAGYYFDDVAGTALTENDIAAARIDSKRAQVFVIEDATTRGQKATVTASNALKVDGSAVTQPVSGTVTSNQGTANTLANAWSIKITDTTNGPAAVKAASTAAAATDPALVVAVSPNNSVAVTQATASNLNAQVVGPGATGAALSGNPVRIAGSDGTNTRNITTDASGRLLVSGAAADGAAVTGNPVLMGGQDGTNAQSILTDTTGRQVVVGAAATGAAVTGNPVLVGGSDGTNAQPIATTTAGVVKVDIQSTAKSVYGASVRSLSPPATPTDMVTITGSATKTIRVLRIILSAIQTTGASQEFLIVKRSTANTAGTSSTATNIPFSSAFAAATATVRSYTANPTLGTAVGTINVVKFFVPAGGTAQRNDYVFDFSNNGLYPGVVLSGTAEVLALNFNGATLPGGLNIDCTVEWSEE